MKKQRKLTQAKVRSLNAIGFCWGIRKRRDWDMLVQELARFKQKHGHCIVPHQIRENQQLACWITEVRRRKRAGDLSRQQIEQLEKLGLVWEPFQQKWQAMYATLVAYKKEHGNCDVPCDWSDSPRLGQWVHWVRDVRKRHRLKPDRIQQLDALGFTWDQHATQWESMYAALAGYQKVHGHCNVSTLSKTRLGFWVKRQVDSRKAGRLSDERIRRLDMLGFTWEMKPWEGRSLKEQSP